MNPLTEEQLSKLRALVGELDAAQTSRASAERRIEGLKLSLAHWAEREQHANKMLAKFLAELK